MYGRKTRRSTVTLCVVALMCLITLIKGTHRPRLISLVDDTSINKVNAGTEQLGGGRVLTHSDKQFGIKSKPIGGGSNGVFITVMESSQVFPMLETLVAYESRFNHRYHYDWVIFSDRALPLHMKRQAQFLTSGKVKFFMIDRSHWSFPKGVDAERAYAWRGRMEALHLTEGNYMDSRHRSRFLSGVLQNLEELSSYDYYWLVEPGSALTCDINYDVFQFMKQEGKRFSFIAAERGDDRRAPSIFNKTLEFIQEFPELIPSDNGTSFVNMNTELDNLQQNYHCEFWSQNEIGDLNWLRSKEYMKFYSYLESTGGFYLENWTDAMFKTLASSILLPPKQVHWFNDIGYTFHGKEVCPSDQLSREVLRCSCDKSKSVTWNPKRYCMHKYFIINHYERPEDWRDHLNRGVS